MSLVTQRKPGDPTDITVTDEKRSSTASGDEKHVYETETVSVTDSSDGDEALKLVGREREAQFSEEYNLKLRRKLVRLFISHRTATIPLRTGSRNPAHLRRGLLHAISVCIFRLLSFPPNTYCLPFISRDKTSLNYARYCQFLIHFMG